MTTFDGLVLALGVFSVAFIFWRTELYLRVPRIGKRVFLKMLVRDGKLGFRGNDGGGK